nr:MAG TPA: hypothetical protein [Caudoviricetes sp.]
MTTIILHNQSLLDIAIQHTGAVENTFAIAVANGLSLTDDLPAGAEIKTPDSANKDNDVLNYYTAKSLQPATAVIMLPEEERLEGIGYWVIQTDFKVS